MTEDQRPKQTAFRLPQKTIDQLDKMVEKGEARNRTDAVILAVDRCCNPCNVEYGELVEKVEKQGQEIDNLYKIMREQQKSSLK